MRIAEAQKPRLGNVLSSQDANAILISKSESAIRSSAGEILWRFSSERSAEKSPSKNLSCAPAPTPVIFAGERLPNAAGFI